jgi:mycothiol synthase
MSNLTIRPATLDDVDLVYQLISRQNILDYGESLTTHDDLCKTWKSSDFNLQTDTLLAFSPEGQPAGYAELQDKTNLSIYLANNVQEMEFASRLLCLMQDKALSQKAGAETLYGRVSENNKTLKQAFESNGYTSNLSFLIMEIVLTEHLQTPQWADEINIRTFIRDQDEQATYQTDEEAGEDKGYHSPLSYADWIKRMGIDRESFDPNIWFLACKGNEIVGVALNFIARETSTGWVDHLSVRRSCRNKGIGKALLLHTFREFYRKGIQRVKLSVDSKSLTNAPQLYESAGMKTIQQYHIFKKEVK